MLYQEVNDFLTSGPSPQRILEFRPSAKIDIRVAELLHKNQDGVLTADEQMELNEYCQLDRMFTLIKAQVQRR